MIWVTLKYDFDVQQTHLIMTDTEWVYYIYVSIMKIMFSIHLKDSSFGLNANGKPMSNAEDVRP
jgi:hypothetical protein